MSSPDPYTFEMSKNPEQRSALEKEAGLFLRVIGKNLTYDAAMKLMIEKSSLIGGKMKIVGERDDSSDWAVYWLD